MQPTPATKTNYSTTREIVGLLYTNIFSGLVMTVLSVSAITFGFGTGNNLRLKIIIWAAMILVTLIRAIDGAYWHLRLRNTSYDPTWPQRRFLSGAILSAILWSVYGVSLFGEMTLLELATTMIIISAMAGGAATILAPHLPLVLLYTTIMLLPMSIRGLIDNNEQFNVIGMLGCLFCWPCAAQPVKPTISLSRPSKFNTKTMNCLA